jgi:hypothetical protein
VHTSGPGVFLQGLATYGPDGQLLEGASLPWTIVEDCFRYSEAENVALCAFLGDECVTTFMSPYLQELHTVYYEPLAQVSSPHSTTIVQLPGNVYSAFHGGTEHMAAASCAACNA